MEWRNEEFDLGGVNHLALVCSDMKRTVEFYTEVLGMRLIKTLNLPGNSGQHFFFDMGGGNALAFFWFPDAPDPVPGVSAPVTVPGSRPRACGAARSSTTTTASSASPGNCTTACSSVRSTSRTRTGSSSSSRAGGGSWGSRATSGTSQRPPPTAPACQPEHVLSWVHVLEWRAAVTPDAVALTDDRSGELTYAGLAAAMEREA